MFFKKTVVAGLFLFVGSATAQQEGSVKIAEAIRPAVETTVSDFTKCVSGLVKDAKLSAKNAVKACNKAARIASHTTTRVANEAADATKSSRPSYGGYYAGGRYYGDGYDEGYYGGRGYHPPPRRGGSRVTSCDREGNCNVDASTGW